ncbi:hypothetical protein Ccrd_017475 [Cynara cardunculus var. scolymus]|uniref:Uncharacterized protein n=1 Tax=Cynara cardunculus var. scolymus TaxID=59895 RepID=A0A103Y812_CYNCS|nr:hypothetical protein Ccrd_017475 [Cynara cardunculus var. scolymus]
MYSHVQSEGREPTAMEMFAMTHKTKGSDSGHFVTPRDEKYVADYLQEMNEKYRPDTSTIHTPIHLKILKYGSIVREEGKGVGCLELEKLKKMEEEPAVERERKMPERQWPLLSNCPATLMASACYAKLSHQKWKRSCVSHALLLGTGEVELLNHSTGSLTSVLTVLPSTSSEL